MEAWGAAVTIALGIITLLLRQWLAAKETKQENIDVTNIQTERQALEENDGSIDAVAADQHDRVLKALGGGGRDRDGDGQEEHH